MQTTTMQGGGPLASFRRRYPQYDHVDDATLADRLHAKFYSDLPREEFNQRIGVGATSQGAQRGAGRMTDRELLEKLRRVKALSEKEVAGQALTTEEQRFVAQSPAGPLAGIGAPIGAGASSRAPATSPAPPQRGVTMVAGPGQSQQAQPAIERQPVAPPTGMPGSAAGPAMRVQTPPSQQMVSTTPSDPRARLEELRRLKALDEQRSLALGGAQALLRAQAGGVGAQKPEMPLTDSPSASQGQSRISGALDSFTDGAAFGFGDNLTAAESAGLRAVGQALEPFGLGFTRHPVSGEQLLPYNEALTRERAQNDRFAEENPIIDTTAGIAGALTGGLGAMRAGATMMRGGSVGRQAVTGGVEAAAYGAAHGAGAADGVEVGDAAKSGAAIGALIGGPMAGGTAALANALMRGAAVKAAPSAQQLKAQADDLFDAA